MESRALKDDLSTFWEFAKGLIFVLGILLFFMGWIYLDSFLSHFGLSLRFIKIEFTTFYFYGFFVLLNFLGFIPFLLFAILFMGIYYLRGKLMKSFYVAILLITILFFGVMYLDARSLGTRKAERILYKKENVNPIRILFKEPIQIKQDTTDVNARYLKKLMELNYCGKLFFLFENSEEIIVFHNPNKPSNDTKGLDKSIEIYKIKKEIIDYYYLSVDNSSLSR